MVTFIAVGLCKMYRNGPSHNVVSNGIECFKAKHGFDNDHLEISMVCMIDQRSHYVKLGYCDEKLLTIWSKCEKGNNAMRLPRTYPCF